jgi:hypothetical protein
MSNLFEGIIYQLGMIKAELEFANHVHIRLKQFSDVWKTDQQVFDEMIDEVLTMTKFTNREKTK